MCRRFPDDFKRRSTSVARSFCDRFDGPPSVDGLVHHVGPRENLHRKLGDVLDRDVIGDVVAVAEDHRHALLANVLRQDLSIQMSMNAVGRSITCGTPLRRIASSMYHLIRKMSTGASCATPRYET